MQAKTPCGTVAFLMPHTAARNGPYCCCNMACFGSQNAPFHSAKRRVLQLIVNENKHLSLFARDGIKDHLAYFSFKTLFGGGYSGLSANLLFGGRYANSSFPRETKEMF